jgi:hypothetical protein
VTVGVGVGVTEVSVGVAVGVGVGITKLFSNSRPMYINSELTKSVDAD